MKHRVQNYDKIIVASQSKKGKVHLIKWKTNFGYESACGNHTPSNSNKIGIDELEDFQDICKSCQKTNYFKEQVGELNEEE